MNFQKIKKELLQSFDVENFDLENDIESSRIREVVSDSFLFKINASVSSVGYYPADPSEHIEANIRIEILQVFCYDEHGNQGNVELSTKQLDELEKAIEYQTN